MAKSSMPAAKTLLSLAIILVFSSCSTVQREIELPNQSLNMAPPAKGEGKVVFYNDSNLLLFGLDGSGRVGIKVDERGIGSPYIGRYVAVNLPQGERVLELSHIDVFTFRDSYQLTVKPGTQYVRAFNRPTSTRFDIQPGQPKDFEENFKPMSNTINQ